MKHLKKNWVEPSVKLMDIKTSTKQLPDTPDDPDKSISPTENQGGGFSAAATS